MIPVFSGAAWWSLRVARADLLQSRTDAASARRAAALTPLNSKARVNAALRMAAETPTTDADEAELRAAVEINPRDSLAWMTLGLRAEMTGDMQKAEHDLLEAARMDHTFRPAWTLANFYMRTDQPGKFWKWARACLELVEPQNKEPWTFDPRPVFDLCWTLSSDAETIQRLAIPPKPFVLRWYLIFLQESGRLDAALATAPALYPQSGPDDLPAFYGLVDRLNSQNRAPDAVPVWNALIERKITAYQPLNPARGLSLTNGDLEIEPLRRGFDWLLNRPTGIYESYSHTTRSIRFDLDGDESEHEELAAQTMAMLPERRYRFHFRYITSEITGAPGFRWILADLGAGKIVSESAPLAARDNDKEETAELSTPRGMRTGRLAFRYDRIPGTTRPKGSFKLSQMRLELVP